VAIASPLDAAQAIPRPWSEQWVSRQAPRMAIPDAGADDKGPGKARFRHPFPSGGPCRAFPPCVQIPSPARPRNPRPRGGGTQPRRLRNVCIVADKERRS